MQHTAWEKNLREVTGVSIKVKIKHQFLSARILPIDSPSG